MITAGPAYSAAAAPVVTKMPAPTTEAMPERGQAHRAHRPAVEPAAVAPGLRDDRVEVPVAHRRILPEPLTAASAIQDDART